jgi:hypothetical protein
MIEILTKKRALELTILEWEELYKFPEISPLKIRYKRNTEVISTLAKKNEFVSNNCFCCEYVYQQEKIEKYLLPISSIQNSYICESCPLYTFWVSFPLTNEKDEYIVNKVKGSCPCEDHRTPWRKWVSIIDVIDKNSLDTKIKYAKDIVDACYFELTKWRNNN